MYEIKNFNNWILDKKAGLFGNGASEKIWLINPTTGEKGLFKFPKIKNVENNIITGEYWAEKLATEIAKKIGIKCAKVDMGTYNHRLGSMSYNIIQEKESLIEGIMFIQDTFPSYDRNKLIDEYNNNKYSLQMIKSSVKNIDEILKMIIFDALIGNSDRHHSNWGFIKHNNGDDLTFCPLYDNGSSLCSYVDQENAEEFIRDSMRYNALLFTKSKSMIGWNNEQPIIHFDLIQKIHDNYYNETVEFVKKIKTEIIESSIKAILDNFDENIINTKMKKLLLKFIIDRKEIIVKIYNLDSEV